MKLIGLIVSLGWLAGHAVGAAAAGSPLEAVSVPVNIQTYNVPALSGQIADRLGRYTETRSATVVGWQEESLLIMTRFGDARQLHRVARPLGYREQLTFLREPLGGASLPRRGARDQIILNWDIGGSEFDQLFLFDLNTGQSRRLSDGQSLYRAVLWAPDEQSIVYVTTQRNGRNWDIHHQTLAGKVTSLLQTDAGYWLPIDWSSDGKRLLVKNRVSIAQSIIYELDIQTRELTPVLGADEPVAIQDVAYDGAGGIFYTADQEGEFLGLYRKSLVTNAVTRVTPEVNWNVEHFELSPDRQRLMYAVNADGLSKIVVLALPGGTPIELPALPPGILRSAVFAPDGARLAVTLNRANAPSDVYVLDLMRGQVERWTQSEMGGLSPQTLATPQLFRYESFDAMAIPAFIYRPQTPGPHPVVISIHGGPESQYRPYFSSTIQSYVREMNVAVIAPNVRGSNGYGKSFLQKDNGRLREDSVKDIGALLDWIELQDDLDSSRVAVMGGSYGGYMVLASMVWYGDRLAAAVDSVGISNFVTFLENTQAYRQDMRRVEYGDERDPQMRSFLEQISPLNHVDQIQTPLYISQGANDPRVPASESEQIRKALEASGVPVWFVLAQDEGHGFAKKGNRVYDSIGRFTFLQQYLKQE